MCTMWTLDPGDVVARALSTSEQDIARAQPLLLGKPVVMKGCRLTDPSPRGPKKRGGGNGDSNTTPGDQKPVVIKEYRPQNGPK